MLFCSVTPVATPPMRMACAFVWVAWRPSIVTVRLARAEHSIVPRASLDAGTRIQGVRVRCRIDAEDAGGPEPLPRGDEARDVGLPSVP